jgi:hypothetical protein
MAKINSKELLHSEKYNVWVKDSSRTGCKLLGLHGDTTLS